MGTADLLIACVCTEACSVWFGISIGVCRGVEMACVFMCAIEGCCVWPVCAAECGVWLCAAVSQVMLLLLFELCVLAA